MPLVSPELRAPVIELMRVMREHHLAGGGEVALLDLVAVLGFRLDDQTRELLRGRGALRLVPYGAEAAEPGDPAGDGAGEFSNVGAPVEIVCYITLPVLGRQPLKITVPERLAGDYLALESSWMLRFDAEASLNAALRLPLARIRRRLEKVTATPQRVDVDVEGREFDQVILLEVPGAP